MKKAILAVMVAAVALGLGSMGSAWTGQADIEGIEGRIVDSERRLLNLNEGEIRARLEWANWGMDILETDIENVEKIIQQKRKKWRNLSRKKKDTDESWWEWERAGIELDELERKRRRLESVLSRLRSLTERMKSRLREIRGEIEPRDFRLGLALGWLSGEQDSSQGVEVKVRTPWVDPFYGSIGVNGNESYFGAEKPIFLSPEKSKSRFFFPVGAQKFSYEDGIRFCAGLGGEFQVKLGERLSIIYGEARVSPGEELVFTALIGLLF